MKLYLKVRAAIEGRRQRQQALKDKEEERGGKGSGKKGGKIEIRYCYNSAVSVCFIQNGSLAIQTFYVLILQILPPF